MPSVSRARLAAWYSRKASSSTSALPRDFETSFEWLAGMAVGRLISSSCHSSGLVPARGEHDPRLPFTDADEHRQTRLPRERS
jgi:hypothetical protein